MLQLSFVNFKQNSYILVEGTTNNDRFFIIQSGHASSFHENSIPGMGAQTLGPGDFVGVISCMSGHSQTESVVAMTNVVAIMVKKEQYPELIMNNTPVAMKIVKSFAHDMRILNENLTQLALNKSALSSPEEIYNIADYYGKSGLTDIAFYGLYQYLKACPHGRNAEQAKKQYLILKPNTKAVYLESSNEPIRSYPKDTMIFSEFQNGGDMFIIQEGNVRITKVVDGEEVTLAVLQKGDMFGEMALLENKPRSASAIAHANCRLMVINRVNFNQMVMTQPQLIAKLTTMFADRLWATYRQLENTQLRDIKARVIDMLALQVEKQKVSYMTRSSFKTDFSPMDIVKLCGIPAEEQSKAIYELQIDPNVKIVLGKIVIPDVMELMKQSQFYRKQNHRRSNEEK